jgi:hypothetical protein
MRALGYKCYIVASTSDQSGTGGRAVFTTTTNLTADTDFGKFKLLWLVATYGRTLSLISMPLRAS